MFVCYDFALLGQQKGLMIDDCPFWLCRKTDKVEAYQVMFPDGSLSTSDRKCVNWNALGVMNTRSIVTKVLQQSCHVINAVYGTKNKGLVHTYPDIFESASSFIRFGLASTWRRRFWSPKTKLLEKALQSGSF